MSGPDYLEVNRKAYELQRTHGRNADQYAAKLAAEALTEGEIDEHLFWKAVEAALKVRSAGAQ